MSDNDNDINNIEIVEGDYKWSDNDDQVSKNYYKKVHTKNQTNIPRLDNKEDIKEQIQNLDIQLDKTISRLEQTLKSLTDQLKTYTDAKGWRAIPKGYLYITRYANYYDVSHTIDVAGSENPNDFDSPVYNTERIFESLQRYAEYVEVANDGTDNLYVVISHGGRTNFSQETPIFPGETKIYYNVYELRLRSPTQGLPYRVTEYDINNVSQTSFIPKEVASLHNQPLPGAGTNWLSSDITPLRVPTTFRIEVTVSIAGTFSAAITNGGNTQIVNFNVVAGPALIPGGQYIFELLVHQGDTVNFRYSTTGGTIQILRVQEIDAALA